jgi:hypothetical protein
MFAHTDFAALIRVPHFEQKSISGFSDAHIIFFSH